MNHIVRLLALLSLVSFGEGFNFWKKEAAIRPWKTVRVRWTLGKDGLYNIPLSVGEIQGNEFSLYKNHEELPKVQIFCRGSDPTVCPLYDHNNYIIGLRVSFIKSKIKPKKANLLEYSYEKPMLKSVTMFDQPAYCIDVFFRDPKKALQDGAPVPTKEEPVGDGAYFNIDGNGWVKVPRREKEVLKETAFTKQACFTGMGHHYFYKMTPTMDCQEHQPPFLLYKDDQMIGFGLIPFGHIENEKDHRMWFEDPPKQVIQMIVPKGPKCLRDWIGKYGGVSLHVFFIPNPRTICPLGFVGGAVAAACQFLKGQ